MTKKKKSEYLWSISWKKKKCIATSAVIFICCTWFILSVFRSALAYRSALTLTWTKSHKPSILTPWRHQKKEENKKHKSSSVKQNIFLCKNFLIAVQMLQDETLKSRFAKGLFFISIFIAKSTPHQNVKRTSDFSVRGQLIL